MRNRDARGCSCHQLQKMQWLLQVVLKDLDDVVSCSQDPDSTADQRQKERLKHSNFLKKFRHAI